MEILTGLLAAMAALLLTRRWLAARAGHARGGGLTDEAIRQIETHGRLARDEPLDLQEIDEEERRFWEEEEWDESEEW